MTAPDVLIDTNALAFTLVEPHRLPAMASDAIRTAAKVRISAVSLYEVSLKVWLGKWPQMADAVDEMEDAIGRAGIGIITLGAAIAREAGRLDWSHRDPFDRMIAAQALAFDVPLVSADRAFDALPLTRIWD